MVYLPNPIVVKSSSEGKGGDSGSGWLALLGIVVTAAVSIFLGYKSGQDAEQARSATSELAKKERASPFEVKVRRGMIAEVHCNATAAESPHRRHGSLVQ